jgi:hypothetical protein
MSGQIHGRVGMIELIQAVVNGFSQARRQVVGCKRLLDRGLQADVQRKELSACRAGRQMVYHFRIFRHSPAGMGFHPL